MRWKDLFHKTEEEKIISDLLREPIWRALLVRIDCEDCFYLREDEVRNILQKIIKKYKGVQK